MSNNTKTQTIIDILILTFIFLFIFFIVHIPILLILSINILIINFMNEYYYNLSYLIIFLIIYYKIKSILLSLIDISFKSKRLTLLKTNNSFNLLLKLPLSYIFITLLDKVFVNIELSTTTKILIILVDIFVTGITSFITNNLQTSNINNNDLDLLITEEVCNILENKSLFACIKIMKQRHPDIPFNKIVKSIRRIHSKINSL